MAEDLKLGFSERFMVWLAGGVHRTVLVVDCLALPVARDFDGHPGCPRQVIHAPLIELVVVLDRFFLGGEPIDSAFIEYDHFVHFRGVVYFLFEVVEISVIGGVRDVLGFSLSRTP